jgi:3-deoxy-D-arabino-heptulosonate 7-phosphate (DAHP) synthase
MMDNAEHSELVFRPYQKRRRGRAYESISASDLLRAARRRVLVIYGPCAAASPTVVVAMARRDIESSNLPVAPRARLLAELAALAGGPGEIA